MDVVVNVSCPQCGNTLVYEEGVGFCLLCASYWMLAHNMIVRTTPPETEVDLSRSVVENIQDIMESAPGVD